MKKLTNFINEAEKSKKQKEYQEFFDKKLKKFDVDSPAKLSDADKKKFFNEIDKEWDQEPTNEKQVEEDYDSEEDEDSKEMKAKKESYESKDKEKDKEELYSSEDEEMEEDSYNESSKKKVNEVTKSDIEKGTKVVIKGTKFDGEEGIIASEDMNGGKYIVQLGDSMKGFKPSEILVKEGVYEADDIELRQAAGLPEPEYDMDGNILEHEKGETAEISISKDEMEKLHKGGKVDINKGGATYSLVFKA